MSSKQATSPFASAPDGDDPMSQDRLAWEKDEGAAAVATAPDGLLPLPNLLHGKSHPEELPPISSIPPEADWDNLLSAQQRMVRLRL